ncbi:prepilin-type N-terminal cleavage/methylation domain-containing protein [Paenibacillus filicis]|uniref:Prepilin-type N-terminal cleavage/methylation domain-containing protein n=1 Tax=Paenibacillus filicis TaxID=669464 RepID=A0ABU9DIA1_9BACL
MPFKAIWTGTPNMNMFRNEKGLTLVELLAAITLIGIIAGVITMALQQLNTGNQVTYARQKAQIEARSVSNHMIGKLREQKYNLIMPAGAATAEQQNVLTLFKSASRTDNYIRYYRDIPNQTLVVETVQDGKPPARNVLIHDITGASSYFMTQSGQTSSSGSSDIQVKYLHLQFQMTLLPGQKGKQQAYDYKTDITIPSWDK